MNDIFKLDIKHVLELYLFLYFIKKYRLMYQNRTLYLPKCNFIESYTEMYFD